MSTFLLLASWVAVVIIVTRLLGDGDKHDLEVSKSLEEQCSE